MCNRKAPVAVFDSGMGGISVLRELRRLLPEEDFLFFGDSAHAPYGTKSLEEVKELTISNIENLMNRGCKAAVVACNTATSAAIQDLRRIYKEEPMIGIEPAVKPAATTHDHVLVMATPMTIRERKFHDLMEKFDEKAEIYPLACPKIVEYVEAGMEESQELKDYLAELFLPYDEKQIDAIVLGCTHFPFVRKAIEAYWKERVSIYDGAAGTARELKRQLERHQLSNEKNHQGILTIENSAGEEKIALSKRLLSLTIE